MKKCSLFLLVNLLLSSFLITTVPDVRAQGPNSVDKTIDLKAVAGLKFSKVRFTVEPGSTIRITLENVDEMMHNMLIVKPGTRPEVVEQAEAMGEQGLINQYVPNTSDVLVYTPLLKPDEKASVIFEVPDEEAIYPYVCTYPAHGFVMYGAIYATNNTEELPPLDEDPNIPEPVRNELAASLSMHPYPRGMPTLTRLFMPESSPAAIAVGMEKDQSYNWDAGYSHLRYVWSGGYIDPSKQWDAKSHEVAEIVGEIYYRNTAGFPFRIAQKDSIPKPQFKGYRLFDGYPRFKYQMGNITVRELILPAETTPGFKIQYNLENVDEPVWYELSDNSNVEVTVSKGKLNGNMIALTPDQAREFTISIVSDK
jgi:azurin